MLGLKSKDLIKKYNIRRVDKSYVVRHCPPHWSLCRAFYDWFDDIVYSIDDESVLLHEISHALEYRFSETSQVKLRAALDIARQSQTPFDRSLIRLKQEATANIFAILASTGPLDEIKQSLKSYSLSARKALHLAQPILNRRFTYMGIDINWQKAYKYVYEQTDAVPRGLFS